MRNLPFLLCSTGVIIKNVVVTVPVASGDLSLSVGVSDHATQSSSSVIHQQMFLLIAVNNKLRKNRLGHDDWIKGFTVHATAVAVLLM